MAGTGGKSCAFRLVAQRQKSEGTETTEKRRKRQDRTIDIV
jgi:hypothetical protein